MSKLLAIYFGTILLMFLSQSYAPGELGRERRTHFIRRESDPFLLLAIFWMFSFSFLRTAYNDTEPYIYFWEKAPTIGSLLSSGALLNLFDNPLSLLWESFSRHFLGNYHLYFLLPALLSNLAAVKLLKHYSVSPTFSMLVFFSIGTYMMYIAALKQSFALFFLLCSIPYAEKKRYDRFYLLIAIAVLFHAHSAMFAIVPLLFEKPWGKITWAGVAAMLFVIATFDATLGAFLRYTDSIGLGVAESDVFDGHGINPLRVAVYWIPPLMALLFRDRLFHDSSPRENLFVNMSTVAACVLTLGTVQAANLFARMAAYFEIGVAISLPWMVKKIFNRPSQRLVFGAAAVCYFVYFLYEFGIAKDFSSQYSAISWWQFLLELVGR